MSVLIPGMEMPDRCFACPMCDTDCCGVSKGSYIEYREVEVDIAIDHRPDWCPLIPVPPHGRLIDADALKASLVFAESTAEWAVPALRAVLMVIADAPTIIPAEEEGEG